MKKYYKRMLTYYEVSENGDYIAITPLTASVTITAGKRFHNSSINTEITEREFLSETLEALNGFWDGISGLMTSKVL